MTRCSIRYKISTTASLLSRQFFINCYKLVDRYKNQPLRNPSSLKRREGSGVQKCPHDRPRTFTVEPRVRRRQAGPRTTQANSGLTSSLPWLSDQSQTESIGSLPPP